MQRKAEAWKNFNDAAVINMVVDKMPELAQAFATQLAGIDKINIIEMGNGNGRPVRAVSGKVMGTVGGGMTAMLAMLKDQFGVDIARLMEAKTEAAAIEAEKRAGKRPAVTQPSKKRSGLAGFGEQPRDQVSHGPGQFDPTKTASVVARRRRCCAAVARLVDRSRLRSASGPPMIIVAAVFGLVIVIWWLFFSRAPWLERLGAIALMVVAVAATSLFVHESVANGMMGFMLFVYSIPVLSLALVAWAVASRRFSTGLRRASMVAAIVLACGTMTLIRTNGLTGDADSDLEWRWTPTPEQRLLAEPATSLSTLLGAGPRRSRPLRHPLRRLRRYPMSERRAPVAAAPEKPPPQLLKDPARATTDAAWPGFRGPERDSVVRGVRIETDWSRTPPVELWRRPIGPGWSSFAVRGDRMFTQEQRGDDEVVSAYNVNTGKPVWRHRDAARFWESNAGAGPRATPTLSNGRVYTLGGTGILNALDARDGSVVWSRNAAADTGSKVPALGHRELAVGRRRRRDRGDGRRTRRLRRRHRKAALVRPEGRAMATARRSCRRSMESCRSCS